MKILFVSFHNKNFDGRTQALINIMREIGHTFVISPSPDSSETSSEGYTIHSNTYLQSIKETLSYVKNNFKRQEFDCLFLDNRRAALIGLLLLRHLTPRVLIYDAHELYLFKETPSLRGKIGCYFEKKIIQKADLVVCANEYRRAEMKRIFKLKGDVVVFDNFRKLEYAPNADISKIRQEYDKYFDSQCFNIISTAGCELNRQTEELVLGVEKLPFPKKLFLVGCKLGKDKDYIENFIKTHHIQNVLLFPRVDVNTLKYLISKSSVGVAMYHQRNFNNKYCSSGKIFEYLYEKIPIATSPNPPLREVLDKYQVGAYDEDINRAIIKVHQHYDYYLKRVTDFVSKDVITKELDSFKKTFQTHIEVVFHEK